MIVLNVGQCFNLLTYQLASLMLICGFSAQFSSKPESGIPLITVGYFIIAIINLYGLMAFLTSIDYLSPSPKMEFDSRLESAVPVVNSFGSLLSLIAMLSMSNDKMSMIWFGLIGSSLLYIGGLLNVLKVYKRNRTCDLKVTRLNFYQLHQVLLDPTSISVECINI